MYGVILSANITLASTVLLQSLGSVLRIVFYVTRTKDYMLFDIFSKVHTENPILNGCNAPVAL
jgi:hypothetical protein